MKRFIAVLAFAAFASPSIATAQIPADFVTSGGDVSVTITGIDGEASQFFLAAVAGAPDHLIFDATGTEISFGGGPYIPYHDLSGSYSVDLGLFDPGTALSFWYRRLSDGAIFTDAVVFQNGDGYKRAGIVTLDRRNTPVLFTVSGINSVAPDPFAAPEPATLALVGTGLLAMVGVKRRPRRTPRE